MTMLKKGFLSLAAIAVMTGFVGCGDDTIISKIDDGNGGDTTPVEVIDTMTWGGGMWYAYASENNVKVATYVGEEGTEEIIVAGDKAVIDGDVNSTMAKMLGTDSLTVVLDAENADGTSYWAAVATPIAGDVEHWNETYGGKKFTVAGDDGDEDVIGWDLSKLKSITVDGVVQGNFNITVKGVNSNNDNFSAQVNIGEGKDKFSESPVAFNEVITVDQFSPNSWQGEEWENLKGAVTSIALELNTSWASKAIFKVNDIVFNFENKDDAKAAFPFLGDKAEKDVIFDDFEINQYIDDSGVNSQSEENYTNQHALGYELGGEIYDDLNASK